MNQTLSAVYLARHGETEWSLSRQHTKLMMNGAPTIGMRDGATIEMAREAGEENFFLFGLAAQRVVNSRNWDNPSWHYDHEPETRAALELIFSDHFSRDEPGIFEPLRETLLTHGDYYMHLADLKSYLEADRKLGELYADSEEWTRKAILKVAGSGKFFSGRTVVEYAAEIWNVKPSRLTNRNTALFLEFQLWISARWRVSPPNLRS